MMCSVLLLGFSLCLSTGNPCRQDWELFGESCYGFGEVEVTWGDAQEMCRSTGSKLAEIETTEENDFLKDQAHNKNGENYWLGGTDVFHEGTWVWMSTGEVIYPFNDWSVGQPDNANEEDCMVLRQNHDYEWNDRQCTALNYFICEMPPEETVVG